MKQFTTGVCAIALVGRAIACDVCGAVNSSLGPGTAALGNRHSFGLTYQFRAYTSNHPSLFGELPAGSEERFQRLDLSGNIRLAGRWQLKATVPAVYNEQVKQDVRSVKRGPGDPTISVHYFVIDRTDSLAARNVRWSVGAGGKLPLGKFSDPHDEVLLLYPGTGTWDAIAQSLFYFRSGNWGLIQESNAVIRTPNKYDYTPGSLFTATLFGFRRFGNWSVFGGFQYSRNGTDYIGRTAIGSSPAEGAIFSATLGGTIQWGNILVQANYHLPVAQRLGNGHTEQTTSFTAGIHYIFNQ